MCGKFTAMYSWREIHAFSQPLGGSEKLAADANDSVVTYRPVDDLPMIVWDRETRQRKVIPMRWGFPHRSNPNRPDPIHARSETVDTKEAFKRAFHDGQRGIVVFQTFNEGKELPPAKPGGKTKTEQWTIDPGDGIPRGFAFVWRKFELGGAPAFYAAVMCTVPASEMIRRTIMEHDKDPRMPAILEEADWETWLAENGAEPAAAKAVLKTMEGVTWKMAPEPKGPKAPRAPSGGLL